MSSKTFKDRHIFTFYRSYYELAKEIPQDLRGQFYEALVEYQFTGKEPLFNGVLKLAWAGAKYAADKQVKGFKTYIAKGNQHDPTDNPEGDPTGVGSGDPSGNSNNKSKNKDNSNDKEKGEYNPPFSFFNFLLSELNCDKQLLKDWIQVRAKKKAANTQTSADLFIKQVKKSKLTADQILTECIERSWAGFKDEWLTNSSHGKDQHQQQTRSSIPVC